MNPQDHADEVPLAWLCAQDEADRLLGADQAPWWRPTFEYRAAQDVLALTLLLTCPSDALPGLHPSDVGALRALVADDVEWALWCHTTLDSGDPDLTPADRRPAEGAFHRLTSGRLLGGSFDESLGICAETATWRGTGLSVGVTLTRRALGAWTRTGPSGHRPNVA